MSSFFLLLIFYSLVMFVAIFIGIRLSDRFTLTHTRMQIVMSFVSGLMLGIAVFHLLPHAVHLLERDGGIDRAATWLMAGLLLTFLMLRLFHFHHHDLSEDCNDSHCTEAHRVDSPPIAKNSVNRFQWLGVVFGLAVHTLIDGVALGASIRASGEFELHALTLAGFGVFLAILLHKPLDALTINSLMRMSGWDKYSRYTVIAGFALLCPLSAGVFLFIMDGLKQQSEVYIALALAFSAGVFLCISLSDLLPEVQFHSHDRFIMTLALIMGLGLALLVRFIEPEVMHSHKAASLILTHEH